MWKKDLEPIVIKVLEDNQDKIDEMKDKPKLLMWFVGQAMKASQGKAEPSKIKEMLEGHLGGKEDKE